MQKRSDPSNAADREIVIERTVKAPRELVFDAFTDRTQISHWWGPHGFTTTTSAMDVRPGGKWRFVMHGPDGTDYQNLVTYIEVDRPRRLVYDHREPDGPMQPFMVTVTFEDVAGGTHVTLKMVCATPEAKAYMAKFGAIEGGEQTLQRLDAVTALQQAEQAKRAFSLTRTFDAPRELVWQAWSTAAHMAAWWGPKEATLDVVEYDFRPGGLFRFGMAYSSGATASARFVFREILKPQRLVYLNGFANEGGGLVRAPFSATWPLEIEYVVTFEEEGGKTRLKIVGLPFGATTEEQSEFERLFASMEQGFGGTLAQLADHLARTQA